MKRVIVMLVLLMLSGLLTAQTMRVGYIYFEPYVISQGHNRPIGGPVGEYWSKYLQPAMGVDVEWVGPLPLLRMLKFMEREELDAILLFPREQAVAENYLYPRSPFLLTDPAVTLNKDTGLNEVSRISEIYNMKISYVKGGYLPPELRIEGLLIDVTTKESYLKVNLEKLLIKRVDAVFNLDGVCNLYEADKYGYGDNFKTLDLPVSKIPCYTVFSNSQRGRSFLNKYDPVNDRLYAEGVLDELILKYFPKSYRH